MHVYIDRPNIVHGEGKHRRFYKHKSRHDLKNEIQKKGPAAVKLLKLRETEQDYKKLEGLKYGNLNHTPNLPVLKQMAYEVHK